MSHRARFIRSPYARTRTRAAARAALNRPWLKTDPAILDPRLGAPGCKTVEVVVIDTQVVAGPGSEIHHWEIACAPDRDHDPGLVLLTRDESLYTAAARVEGHERRVRVTYHHETRGLQGVDVLDRIAEVAP